MIDVFKRYQKGLTLNILFPQRNKSICACGCKTPLLGKKKRWASKDCQSLAVKTFFIIKGDVSVIRKEVFRRDKSVCAYCKEVASDWQADHILPVHLGGGGCNLDNFQTLCRKCHLLKTSQRLAHLRAISSQAISI